MDDEEFNAPLTRDEFKLYDAIKTFSMLTFFASLIMLVIGKTGLHAARVPRQMAVKHMLRRSTIFTVFFFIFAFLAAKEAKHMKKIMRGVENQTELEAANKTTSVANETEPMTGRQLGSFIYEPEMDMGQMQEFSFEMPMIETNQTETKTASEWDGKKEAYRMFASRVYD